MKKIILFLIGILMIKGVFAQSPLSGDVQTNTLSYEVGAYPYSSVIHPPGISCTDDGKYATAFNHRMSTSTSDPNYNKFRVSGRAYSNTGAPNTSAQTIMPGTPPSAYDGDYTARISMFNNGDYIVVYEEENNSNVTSPNFHSIHYQNFYANGTPKGSKTLVDYGMFPDVDVASDGTFNISYVSGHYYYCPQAVYVKRYVYLSGTGGYASLARITVESKTCGQAYPGYYQTNIKSFNGSSFAVGYQDGGATGNYTIKEYSSSGTNVFLVNVSGTHTEGSFIKKPNGEYVSVCNINQGILSGPSPYNNFKTAIKRFTSGILSTPEYISETGVVDVSNSSGLFNLASIGCNNNGDYVITFPKYVDGIYQGIYIQQYDVNNNKIGNEYPLSTVDNNMKNATVDVSDCYFVVAWSDNGKAYHKRFALTPKMIPSIATTTSTFCIGDPLTFTGVVANGNSQSHEWEMQECTSTGSIVGNPISTQVISGNPGTYTFPNTNIICNKFYRVKLSLTTECEGQMVETMKIVYIACKPKLVASPDYTICPRECVTIGPSVGGTSNTFQWSSPDSKNIGITPQISVCPTVTTTYTLTVTNNYGCTNTDHVTVTAYCPPASCFDFVNANQTVANENSYYGTEPVTTICLPNVIIDGSCSSDEIGYHLSISEFDLMSWQNIPPMFYEGWVNTTSQVPSSINLSTLVGTLSSNTPNGVHTFQVGHLYRVGLSVGPVWNSVTKFFRVKTCAARTGKLELEEIENPNSTDYLINIYPNPTNGKFNVDFKGSSVQQITVYDAVGKIVSENKTEANSTNVSIDLSEYSSGIYFIKLNTGEKTIMKKVVKE